MEPVQVKICGECGTPFPPPKPKQEASESAKVIELGKQKRGLRREQGAAKTYVDLLKIEKERGLPRRMGDAYLELSKKIVIFSGWPQGGCYYVWQKTTTLVNLLARVFCFSVFLYSFETWGHEGQQLVSFHNDS